MGFVFGHCCDVGQTRELNEDSYLAMAAPAAVADIDALLLVADGVGGHNAGEIASGYVAETFQQLFSSTAYRSRVDYSPQREDYFAAVLKEILEQINTGLQDKAARQHGLSGMGTTATVAVIAGRQLFLGHVGDTRAYLFRRSHLQRLTTDHTWVEEQVMSGALTPEQAAVHPRRNVLTRSLGNRPVVRVDRSIHTLEPQDTLLLCSDGLSGKVSDVEMEKTLQGTGDPQKVCDFLVNLANQRGGEDNITALAVRVSNQARGNNLPGGLAVGPRIAGVSSEAAATQKIRRPKASWRTSRLTKRLVAALFYAVVVIVFVCASGLFNASVVDLIAADRPWVSTLVPALWTLGGVVVGFLGGLLLDRA
jgi:serine/threonine protein phosphatase PrpC